MKAFRTLALSLVAASALASGAHAEKYYTLSAGAFDFDDNYEAAHFGLEFRGERFWHGLLPIVGLSANTDGGAYLYGGLNYDFDLGERWVITPSFAVSAYTDGDSRDLGGVIEFRSMIGVDYRFENQHRLGVSFGHMSNAGIYDSNPGTELLMLNYSVPVGVFR